MPSREELWDMLRENGAETRDSVTKKTSLLLVGEGYGQTKIQKAIKYNIPTLSLPMAEYLGLLEPHGKVTNAQLSDILPTFVLNHALTCELLYAAYLRRRSGSEDDARRLLGAFYFAAAGLSELLRNGWGSTAGDNDETVVGYDVVVQASE